MVTSSGMPRKQSWLLDERGQLGELFGNEASIVCRLGEMKLVVVRWTLEVGVVGRCMAWWLDGGVGGSQRIGGCAKRAKRADIGLGWSQLEYLAYVASYKGAMSSWSFCFVADYHMVRASAS